MNISPNSIVRDSLDDIDKCWYDLANAIALAAAEDFYRPFDVNGRVYGRTSAIIFFKSDWFSKINTTGMEGDYILKILEKKYRPKKYSRKKHVFYWKLI